MTPGEVEWVECAAARAELEEVRRQLGDDLFAEWRASLKTFLCDYFSCVPPCVGKQGKSISPVPAGVPRAKGLKVRFAYPGCGTRGGLRLAILAFCAEQLVKVAGAWRRKDDPDDGDFEGAFRDHGR